MKKENDEITDLFRTRLADAGMNVRDGFWEELSQEIPVACQHPYLNATPGHSRRKFLWLASIVVGFCSSV